MKRRVLIYYPENRLAPVGGPAGYLYNLKAALDAGADDGLQIDFLPAAQASGTVHGFLKRHAPERAQALVRALKMARLHQMRETPAAELSRYDAVHFHATQDLYACREALKAYTGQVILTSHTPCASFREKLDRLHPLDRRLLARQLETLERIDRYAFTRADWILFPCEEAEEPYFHTWPTYAAIRDPRKHIFVPTGIRPCRAQMTRAAVRETYGIPQDAFVVSFVGRHNEIKGYAELRAIGERLLSENVWFLVAGREAPMRGPKHPHWIEAGFTRDPHSLIRAADVFVLPNRETYFDLVMLEALSLGQIVLASNTGGNRYFARYASPGILLFGDRDEAVAGIRTVMRMDRDAVARAESANAALFQREFTAERFCREYVEALGRMLAHDA